MVLGTIWILSSPSRSLRGEDFHIGDAATVSTTTKLTGGTVRVRSFRDVVEMPYGMEEETTTVWTVRGVRGREIFALDGHLQQDRTTHRTWVEGQTPDVAVESSPQVGSLLRFDRDGRSRTWSYRVEGGKSPVTATPFSPLTPWDPGDSVYPAEPVRAGETWTRTDGQLFDFLGTSIPDAKGTFVGTLETFESVQGTKYALISARVEVSGTFRNPEMGSGTVTLKGNASIVRTLPRGIDLFSRFEGDARLSLQPEDTQTKVEISGPVEIEESIRFERAGEPAPDTATANSFRLLLESAARKPMPVRAAPQPLPAKLPVVPKPTAAGTKLGTKLLLKVLTRGKA